MLALYGESGDTKNAFAQILQYGIIDYWDASEQFYMKLPIIGGLLRLIRKQAASS